MRVAQRLYENGFITYMRTDSTNLSETALAAARAQARELYGDAYVPAEPRIYTRKVKNAQEAHEAIRPVGDTFRTPGQVAGHLSSEEFRLYELIWQRTLASQMADAVGTTVSVRLAGTSVTDERAEFATSGRTITFPGFLRAYVEDVDESAEKDDAEKRLPQLERGQAIDRARVRGRRSHDLAAGALHRAVAGQGAGGARHRPPVDLRVDHADDSGSRLRLEEGRRARPVLDGVRGDRTAGVVLRPAGRLRLHRQRSRTTWTRSPTATTSRVDWLRRFYFGADGAVSDPRRISAQGGLKRLIADAAGGDRRARRQLDPDRRR